MDFPMPTGTVMLIWPRICFGKFWNIWRSSVLVPGSNDAQEARAVCAGIAAGELVGFDTAYVEFKHLYELLLRGVFWISRAKSNMQYEVV